jgi:hypothetical protein
MSVFAAGHNINGVADCVNVVGVANPAAVNGVAAAGGATYSDITFYWGMEGATWSDAEHADGSTTGTIVSGADVETSTVKVGSKSMKVPTTSDYVSFTSSSNFSHLEGGFGAWIYIPDEGTGGTYPDYAGIFDIRANADNILGMYTVSGPDNQICAYYKAGGSGFETCTNSPNVTTNAWYYVWYRWKKSTDTYTLKIYDSSDNLDLDATLSGTSGTWASTPEVLKIGEWINASSMDVFYFDNVTFTNSYDRDLHAIRNCTDCF